MERFGGQHHRVDDHRVIRSLQVSMVEILDAPIVSDPAKTRRPGTRPFSLAGSVVVYGRCRGTGAARPTRGDSSGGGAGPLRKVALRGATRHDGLVDRGSDVG